MSADQFGLRPEIIQGIRSVFEKLSTVERAILYGSRAKGTHRDGSDIDLTLVGPKLTTSDLLRIETDLEELLLPYKIDLSLLSQIDNSDLLDHIKRVGCDFYVR